MMNESICNNEVLIIVVFYKPTLKQIESANNLSKFNTVIVVDNSDFHINNDFCFIYKHLGGNKGIAKAQNVGIEYAINNGFKYVLLLDQDSGNIDKFFVENLYNNFQNLKKIDKHIGFLGPVYFDERTHVEYKNYTKKNECYSRKSAIIASGSLISVSVLKDVGLMDESLFIDLVDFEWCWRAGKKGYTGYMTRNVIFNHSIGSEYHNWHGFVLGLSSPFRYYYQYRNTLWLLRRDYVPLKWKIKSTFRGILDIFLIPLFSKDGIKCLRFIMKGIKAGI